MNEQMNAHKNGCKGRQEMRLCDHLHPGQQKGEALKHACALFSSVKPKYMNYIIHLKLKRCSVNRK